MSYEIRNEYGTRVSDTFGTRDFAIISATKLAKREGKDFHVYICGDRYGPACFVVTVYPNGMRVWADGIKCEYA